jgi:hypothetical protein
LHRRRGSEHRCYVCHYAMHLPPNKAELSNGTGTGMLVVRNMLPSIPGGSAAADTPSRRCHPG